MSFSKMRDARFFGARWLSLVVLAFGLGLPVQAQVLNLGTLGFETDGQSMWGSGAASVLDESVFVGTTWDTPPGRIGTISDIDITTPGIPPILLIPEIPRTLITPAIPSKTIVPAKRICIKWIGCTTTPAVKTPYIPAVYSPYIPAVYSPAVPPITIEGDTGARVEAQTSGKVGLDFSVKAQSGTVDADVAFDAQLIVPDEVTALEFFSLSGSATAGAQSFVTDFPSLEAKAEFVIDVDATVSGEICVAGKCADGTADLGIPGEARLELISYNEDDNGRIRLLGLDALGPADFNFGDPIDLSPTLPVGTVTVFTPNLETTGTLDEDTLVSSGEADILDIKADLDGIATSLMGLPPLGKSLNAGIFEASYDLLSLEFGPIISVLQDFEADVELMVDLEFSAPIFVEGEAQQVDFLSVPFGDIPRLALGFDQAVDVTTEFWLDANLTNTTSLGVDAEFVFEALKASFALTAFGASYDLGDLGPLLEYRNRFDVADLPPLYEKNFTLGGFNRVAGATFSLSTLPPDPGTGGGSGAGGGTGTSADAAAALKDAAAVLITGSPVTLSQEVGKPASALFDFSFDYQFVENGDPSSASLPTLDVFLAGVLVDTIVWSGEMLSFATHTLQLTTADYFDSSDLFALLKFVFDGPGGSILLIDNVVFPDVVNGNFNLGSLTGGLTGWKGEAATAAGSVGVVVFETPIPGTLVLLIAPLLLFGGMRRRKMATHG